MNRTIMLDGQQVTYELEIKNVKNINLRIKPDQKIYVSANSTVPQQVIDNMLIEKDDYILKVLEHYREIAKYAPSPKQYVDGETFKILGHDYRLKVIEGKKASVVIDGTYVVLTVKEKVDLEIKKRTMDGWLKKKCEETVCAVCEAVYPKFKKYEVGFPEIRFRSMVSRWGSCQPKRGVLTFNLSLIEAPIAGIEYVVVHEFVHFLQPDHSKAFYQQLSAFLPDWSERKRLLERT